MRIQTDQFCVTPGKGPILRDRDPAGTGSGRLDRGEARKYLKNLLSEVAELQERLYAESRQSLLVVLQAMDTGGKDSTIRAVTRGINPQGVIVTGFKAPSKRELARDFLWRVHAAVPPKGHIGIFNRSHYEDVLIVKVHGWASGETIDQRYEQINAFEGLLAQTGTRVLKVMLHISKEYQRERLLRRLANPEKHWKFNPADLKERARWDEYMAAYEMAITRCSTPQAPWYVVPSEKRWFRNAVIAQLMVDALREMNPQFPAPEFDPKDFPPESVV